MNFGIEVLHMCTIEHYLLDFLSFKKYDLRISSERITCKSIYTRDKRHK